jgi:hypothetical protein
MSDRARYWAGVLTAWERSGLSQAEYCRRQGLKAITFSWWKRQLRGPSPSPRRRARTGAGGSASPRRPAFVEVICPSSSPAAEAASISGLPAVSGGYEIVLAGGRVIRLPQAFDPHAVAQLIAAAESC